MSWQARARRRRFLDQSLWPIPVACMAAALLLAPLVHWVDGQTRWILLGFGPDGARAVVGALSASLLTFLVFALSTLLLVAQVASGQFTPRIIARALQNPFTKSTLGALVFAWVYSLASLGRIEDRVPQLSVALAVLLSLAGVGLFVYLAQRVLESMRPVCFLAQVARDTLAVMRSLYPHEWSPRMPGHPDTGSDPQRPRRLVRHRGEAGVVLAFDAVGLVQLATQSDCRIELVPQVGDFLASGDDLFALYGAGAEAVEEAGLADCVALGAERTLEQDPSFGLRIIVDVANKALSPGINDPTTAVLAIDQLQHLLRFLAGRQLDRGELRDTAGGVRLIYRTPDWEDFLTLAVLEIMTYGIGNPQVTRRLRAMLDDLLTTAPSGRSEAVTRMQSLLQRKVEQASGDPEACALSLRADPQGFGAGRRRNDPS